MQKVLLGNRKVSCAKGLTPEQEKDFKNRLESMLKEVKSLVGSSYQEKPTPSFVRPSSGAWPEVSISKPKIFAFNDEWSIGVSPYIQLQDGEVKERANIVAQHKGKWDKNSASFIEYEKGKSNLSQAIQKLKKYIEMQSL